jgi:hypothetical protein
MGAVELDQGRVARDAHVPLYPLGSLTAGRYFMAARAYGSPAYTIRELQLAPAAAQAAADKQSLLDGDVRFASGTASASGVALPVEGTVGGGASSRGACVSFLPAAAVAPGQTSAVVLRLPPGRVSVSAGAAPVTVSVRRFAPTATTLGTIGAHGSATLAVFRDRAPQAWHLQVQSLAPVRVCTLSGT